MPTFDELYKQMTHAKYRQTVLRHLVEYIDENFRPTAGQPAKKILLTDEKLSVPAEIFEEIAQELNQEDEQAREQVENIKKSNLK